ncbi:hypothetical protein V6R21_27825 [Limibacter armeniacum]|uniref:hypothetical protein n=1 Tax=Limibacter armeniacum TaxID=466084 RepID=UPI002FE673BE
MKTLKVFFLLVMISGLAACRLEVKTDIDTKAVNKELQSRKIRRISDTEISQEAYKRGTQIGAFYKASLDKQESICSLGVLPTLPDSLKQFVLRSQVICETPADSTTVEFQLYEAYRYALEQGGSIKENLQEKSETEYLYSLPFTYQEGEVSRLALLNIALNKKQIVLGLY